MSFNYDKTRDAWATIRGFVYQVEATILRWLELDDTTVLYCECGEDIDHVRKTIDPSSGNKVEERLLEQVKHQQKTVSLRSSKVIEALANFYYSYTQNPKSSIKLRFTTTAKPGKECDVNFPRDFTGIEAWTEVSKGELKLDEVQETLKSIRALISSASIPPAFSKRQDIFKALQSFVELSDDKKLIKEFLQRVEWATGQSVPLLTNKVKSHVRKLGYADSDIACAELYNRLFVYVFRTLSKAGEKRLDGQSLQEVISRPSLSASDQELIGRVALLSDKAEAYLKRIVGGIDTLQTIASRTEEKVNTIQQVVTSLFEPGKDLPTVEPLQMPQPDMPPYPPHFDAPRQMLINQLSSELGEITWLALIGAAGMGKTQLARALRDLLQPQQTVWISLREFNKSEEGASKVIGLHLTRWLTELTSKRDYITKYYEGALDVITLSALIAQQLKAGALVIIDDIPDFTNEGRLYSWLVALGKELKGSGSLLLTTGQYDLPSRAQEVMAGSVRIFKVPPMEKDDILAVLKSANAPPNVQQEGVLALLTTVTNGHPTLVSATIQWLYKQHWRLDSNFDALLKGEPTDHVRKNARSTIVGLIEDEYARELLYRLSLVKIPFSKALVFVVSTVTPTISHPGEYFERLLGPWVNQLEKDKYEISPLLSDSGEEYLQPDIKRFLHLEIAKHYLSYKTVDQHKALQIAIHLSVGQAYVRLASLLTTIVLSVKSKEEASHVEWVTWFFPPGKEWPKEINYSLRIILRAFQIRLASFNNKNAKELEEDLSKMVDGARPEEDSAVAVALLETGLMAMHVKPEVAIRRTIEAIRRLRRTHLPPIVTLPKELETLIWASASKFTDLDEIKNFLEIIKSMTDAERERLFAGEVGLEGANILADQCWMLMREVSINEADWKLPLNVLDKMSEIGKLAGAGPLAIAAVRARAIVLSDSLNRPDDAIQELEEAMPTASPELKFLLDYTLACITLDWRKPEEALEYYKKALSAPGEIFKYLRFDALRRSAESAGRCGRQREALRFCLKAFHMTQTIDNFPKYEGLEMLGELAWVLWLLQKRFSTCKIMARIVNELDSISDKADPRYRETFLKTGHVLGWLTSVVTEGNPPQKTINGSSYTSPFPGLFSRRRAQIVNVETPTVLHVLFMQAGMFASHKKLDELAWTLFSRAAEIADQEGLQLFKASVLGMELVLVAIRLRKFDVAIGTAISASKCATSISKLKESNENILISKININDLWFKLPEQKQREAQNVIFWLLFGPLFVALSENDISEPDANETFGCLEESLKVYRKELLDIEYWQRMLQVVRLAYSTKTGRVKIQEEINRLSNEEVYLKLLLYLGLSRQEDAFLADCVQAQALVFQFLFTAKHEKMLSGVILYIFKFWKRISNEQGFSLRNPAIFREEVGRLSSQPNIVNGARVLLLAADAVSVRLHGETKKILLDATKVS